jgi:hypothetical protein
VSRISALGAHTVSAAIQRVENRYGQSNLKTTITKRRMLAAVRSAAVKTPAQLFFAGHALRASVPALVALAAAVVGLLLTPAGSASATDSAVVTIGQLEAEGFDVNVDRIGSAPLSECTVTSVRDPQEQTRVVRVDGRRDRDRFIRVVVNRTITVSLDCSSR